MLFIFDKVDVRMGRENHNVDNYIIGTKLKEFRQQAGLSLAKVAESVGVTPAFISMVENGKCGISFQKVHALVKLYGKTLADVTSTHPLADEKVINLNAASEVAFEPGIKAFGLVDCADAASGTFDVRHRLLQRGAFAGPVFGHAAGASAAGNAVFYDLRGRARLPVRL